MKIYGVARKGRELIIIYFHFKTIVTQIIFEIWKSIDTTIVLRTNRQPVVFFFKQLTSILYAVLPLRLLFVITNVYKQLQNVFVECLFSKLYSL